DPGADSPWAVDVDWGDGSAHTTFNAANPGSLGTRSHAYADNGLYTLTVTVTDKDGASDIGISTITVNNVAPVITAAANQTAGEGTAQSFSLGSFTDPGADSPWAVDVNWGDGSAHSVFSAGAAGSLGSRTHTYADNGTFSITVKV